MRNIENTDFSIEESEWGRTQIEHAAAKTGNSNEELEKLSEIFLEAIQNRRTLLSKVNEQIASTRRGFLKLGLVAAAGAATSFWGWNSKASMNAGIDEKVDMQYPKEPADTLVSANKTISDFESEARASGRKGDLEDLSKKHNPESIQGAYKIVDTETDRFHLKTKLEEDQIMHRSLLNIAFGGGLVTTYFGGVFATIHGAFHLNARLSRRKLLLPLSRKTK